MNNAIAGVSVCVPGAAVDVFVRVFGVPEWVSASKRTMTEASTAEQGDTQYRLTALASLNHETVDRSGERLVYTVIIGRVVVAYSSALLGLFVSPGWTCICKCMTGLCLCVLRKSIKAFPLSPSPFNLFHTLCSGME